MALRAAKRQSREWGVIDRREGGTLGGVRSQWVERDGASGELVKKGRSQQVNDELSIPGQEEQDEPI